MAKKTSKETSSSPILPWDELSEGFKKIDKFLNTLSQEQKDQILVALKEKFLSDATLDDIIKITEDEWRETHPNTLSCGSDKFYTRLVNDLISTFLRLNLPANLPNDLIPTCAKSIAAYMEDLKSDLGVWDAVRSSYQRRYGKKLPFYEITDEYYDDDLNIEDMQILIWQAFNRCGAYENRTFSPFSQAVMEMAQLAYDILIDRYDDAPASTRLYDLIKKIFANGDYYEARKLAIWLSVYNPLTAPPFAPDQINRQANEMMDIYKENNGSDLDFSDFLYFAEADYAWLEYMALTGYSAASLLATLAEKYGYADLAKKLLTVKAEPAAPYVKVSEAKSTVTFRNSISEEFVVPKNSFAKGLKFDDKKGGYLSLTRYGDVYMVDGICHLSEELPRNFDEQHSRKLSPDMLALIDEVVARNGGRRLYYCKDMAEVAKVLDNKMSAMPISDDEDLDPEAFDNLLLMLSSTKGTILDYNCCDVFKDKANPFYRKYGGDRKAMDAMSFIFNNSLPDDVIEYIVGHNLLPSASMHAMQGKAFGKRIVQDNMDFLFHFYRVDAYEPLDFDYDDEYDDDDDYDDDYGYDD